MHKQQAIPAALTHTPRAPPPTCMPQLPADQHCMRARTHAHTAPRLFRASVHTTRAQRLPPESPAHAMPLRPVVTRPARAQRPSPGARAHALRCLLLAGRHSAPGGGGGGGGGGTATHCRPSSSVRYTGRVEPRPGARTARGKEHPVATRERISKAPATHTNVRGRMACTGNKPCRRP
jgi:hypothetical protein